MLFRAVLIILITILLIQNRRYRWFYIIYRTIRRDIRAAFKFLILNYLLWKFQHTRQTVPKVFTKIASKHPDRVAFYYEDRIWTYRDVEKFSNKIANFFKQEGYKKGDTIALLLESRPEYVCIWLGLAKIGVITALINNNLIVESLIYSINVSDSKAVIYGSAFKKSIEDITDRIDSKLYQFNETDEKVKFPEGAIDLTKGLENQSEAPPVEDIEKGNSKDKLIFIYTSGTTGLPKAAVITHMRYVFMAMGLHYMSSLNKNDIIYDPLPLYHSAGGVVGVGQALLNGITVVIRKKFSASNFWKDCVKYKCTAAQYIGEICRYILLAHSKNKEPVVHNVKKIIGNGLRPQIWEQFVKQFNIKEVYEFYGATEGNSNLINIDSTVGAVGFIPRYANFLYPVTLIKCDEVTGVPIRGPDGFCMRCKPGEVGVLLGNVKANTTTNEFTGYADKAATEKKLIKNVFKKGDVYFNSGDVLVQDEFGYFYFKDRTGDTFRWKGENVATSEVEAIISNICGLSDAAVYGVEVPETEGRAGMATIVDTNYTLDVSGLSKGLKENLPSYAIPIFLRVSNSVPLTGTFKLKKYDLQKEGFNVHKVKDKLLYYDAKTATYVELTKGKYDDIMTGKIRL